MPISVAALSIAQRRDYIALVERIITSDIKCIDILKSESPSISSMHIQRKWQRNVTCHITIIYHVLGIPYMLHKNQKILLV